MFKNIVVTFFYHLLENSDSPVKLKLISFLLNQKIAFNLAHKIKIKELKPGSSTVSLPLIRRNTNHMGTIHACAMATVGEFAAGIILLKEFGITDYRLIMKDMQVEFKKQANTSLTAEVREDQAFLQNIRDEMNLNKVSVVELTTQILNNKQVEVAIVKTTWQLKKWSDIKFKVN